ncbi:MAP kinase kinase Wis1 [Taxawa tesnikishii (nom. ined.)]|nr:MAP kinase kinase Wis1 [Dothideales sp. JES 119]
MSNATTAGMTASSTPLGNVQSARGGPRPPPNVGMGRGGALNPDIAAKMRAFHLTRSSAPPPVSRSQSGIPNTPGSAPQTPGAPSPAPSMAGGIPSNIRLPPGMQRPIPHNFQSAPAVAGVRGPPGRGPSLAEKRGLNLAGGLPGQQGASAGGPPAGGRVKPRMTLSQITANGDTPSDGAQQPSKPISELDRYSEFIDKETGSLKFKGKAVLTNKGVEFANGQSFNISLDEVDTLDELGKGNYGTVYKVRHARPQMRRVGQGLAGNKALPQAQRQDGTTKQDGTTGIVMAMKELRLELDDAKFAAIIMELDILHRCISPSS